MAIIKASATNPDTSFTLDGLDYQKGIWEVYYSNIITDDAGDVDTDQLEIGIRNQHNNSYVLQSPLPIDGYLDSGETPYASLTTLLTDMSDLLGFDWDYTLVVSADANNDITEGTDGGAFLDVSAEETDTNTSQNATTGRIRYTSESGSTYDSIIKSTDANNDLSIGTDKGLFFNIAASETTTSISQAASGTITYTDEDGGTTDSIILSTDADNALSAGTDKGVYLDTADLSGVTVSADANNDITAGTDGGAYLTGVPVITEGTFTPFCMDDLDDAAYTETTATGVYTKIGDMVSFSIYLDDINYVGTRSGTFRVGNLPYTNGSMRCPVAIGEWLSVSNANFYTVHGFVEASTSYIEFRIKQGYNKVVDKDITVAYPVAGHIELAGVYFV